MNYVQNLILYNVISATLIISSVNIYDYFNNSLINAIKYNSKKVEEIALLYSISKDNNVLYSNNNFPSSKDGGIDFVLNLNNYTSYYDKEKDKRIFNFLNENIDSCFFEYDDKTGKTTMSVNCGLTQETKNNIEKTFEIENNE